MGPLALVSRKRARAAASLTRSGGWGSASTPAGARTVKKQGARGFQWLLGIPGLGRLSESVHPIPLHHLGQLSPSSRFRGPVVFGHLPQQRMPPKPRPIQRFAAAVSKCSPSVRRVRIPIMALSTLSACFLFWPPTYCQWLDPLDLAGSRYSFADRHPSRLSSTENVSWPTTTRSTRTSAPKSSSSSRTATWYDVIPFPFPLSTSACVIPEPG